MSKRNLECSNPECQHEWVMVIDDEEAGIGFNDVYDVPIDPCPKCGSPHAEGNWMTTPLGFLPWTDISENPSKVPDAVDKLLEATSGWGKTKDCLAKLILSAKDDKSPELIKLRKEGIEGLRELQRYMEWVIQAVADDWMGHSNGQWVTVSTEWDCPKSPFGLCAYFDIRDPAHDDCLFCHEPQERK